MATELKYGKTVILSAFEIEQHQFLEGEKGYLELLTVKRPEREPVHVVHELCSISGNGCFVECCSLAEAERIFKIASGNDFSTEWFLISRSMNIKKNVIYCSSKQPWFYSEDKKIYEDKFIPSYLT